ncbi:diaminopimelate epimerase [Pseudokineococcus lusitanus]|uniref:Diaminopimelate epimerase n=1 Tax=Pseudokineococcus lusitanus TaxID=763993 RepID=A0A3N1HTF1_9ACTN|nr:diaminopimelate epimerase [Pseudokineococcus lusitanus]ROP45676.1 diaminopimelate epimerase [Pseudokineococcus lusitanus]
MTSAVAEQPGPTAPGAPLRGLRVAKGHGTENDFVLVTDEHGRLDLDAAAVAALCDRRAGVGGDGLIRAVRSDALAEGAAALAEDPSATWFMDYRNADGSAAEMCGNGVRVLVAHLLREGLVAPEELADGRTLAVGTRSGVKRVAAAPDDDGRPGWFAVDMGPWSVPGGDAAVADGFDATVAVRGLDGVPRPGLSFDLGNPHVVVALTSREELEGADLLLAPEVAPAPAGGTNVELVVPLDAPAPGVGALLMRVSERGVGETRSCGTGACAAALAVRLWAGADSPDVWRVAVPGGALRVTALPGGRVELAGPAVVVADVVLA